MEETLHLPASGRLLDPRWGFESLQPHQPGAGQ